MKKRNRRSLTAAGLALFLILSSALTPIRAYAMENVLPDAYAAEFDASLLSGADASSVADPANESGTVFFTDEMDDPAEAQDAEEMQPKDDTQDQAQPEADEMIETADDIDGDDGASEETLDATGALEGEKAGEGIEDTEDTGEELPPEESLEVTDGEDEQLGYIYPEEKKYYITFVAEVDGKQVRQVYENNKTSYFYLDELLNPTQLNNVVTIGGMKNTVTGWRIYRDGWTHYIANNDYLSGRDAIISGYQFEPKEDYLIVAKLIHPVTESGSLMVETIPA
ncbi:MAG: hypothetical protein IKR47_05745, partial [Lachnospiraceae bacterium]|nr:hypothetical protein [Lachnospiraceae bacterium]